MLGSARSPYSDDRREAGGHDSAKRFFNRLLGGATAAPQVGPLDMTKLIPATSPGECKIGRDDIVGSAFG